MEKTSNMDSSKSHFGDTNGDLPEHDFPDRLGPNLQEDIVEFPARPKYAFTSPKNIETVSKKSCRAVTLSCYVISVTAILYVMEKLIARDEFWSSAATFLHMLNCTQEK